MLIKLYLDQVSYHKFKSSYLLNNRKLLKLLEKIRYRSLGQRQIKLFRMLVNRILDKNIIAIFKIG
jgi:hypothetical protein